MLVLLIVAFVSGLLTILAPCIWPILPIVLSSSSTGGRGRPLGVTLGILLSFSILTLSLSYLVKIFHFDPDILRLLAVVIIGFFGSILIIPKLASLLEGYASRIGNYFGGRFTSGSGFWSGMVAGISLGVVWAPCAGPILATIAALSATRAVNSQVVLITITYMIGTGIPLFLFAAFGSHLLTKSRVLSPFTGFIQQALGLVMIITAVLIWTGYDKLLQARLLNLFPAYTDLIYRIEQTNQVQEQLNRLQGKGEGKISTLPKSFLPDMGMAPDFVGIGNWLNSTPLTLGALEGKVILVDFWTYSCINCIRTLPFVTGWYEKYKDQGLVVVGIHTPEFEFEKKTENVANAIKMFGINYPVAQDNNYSTWNNYNNSYWPAKYLIDKDGHLRYQHSGEGLYAETEKAIQTLLAETGRPVPQEILSMPDQTPRIRLTPETYLGKSRMKIFSPDFKYLGEWNIENEFGESSPGSSLELDFYANKVFLVITPNSPTDIITVSLDGMTISDDVAGKDVFDGKVLLDTARLYELINLRGNPGTHVLRLDFGSKGTKVFAFTFG